MQPILLMMLIAHLIKRAKYECRDNQHNS
jgi:hypothetical protein